MTIKGTPNSPNMITVVLKHSVKSGWLVYHDWLEFYNNNYKPANSEFILTQKYEIKQTCNEFLH